MAILGRFSGGTAPVTVSTTWSPVTGIGTATDRNDGSAYSWNSGTSVMTLPSSNLADGYLVIARTRFQDSSNARANPQLRWIQSNGTGNFVSQWGSGYVRNTNNNDAYITSWGFIDTPSASAELTLQWQIDADAITINDTEAYIDIIPLFYQNCGIYQSTTNFNTGGTTPNQVQGWTTVVETSAIRSGNVVTPNTGKTLALGGWFVAGVGAARTQRWGGFRKNGTKRDDAKSYAYMRNASNDTGGNPVFLCEDFNGTDTIDMFIYRGDGVASGQGGADVDGSATPSASQYAMVILQLADTATIANDQNTAQTADYDLTTYVTSGASISATSTADYFIASNIAAASFDVATGTRYQGEARLHVNGTVQNETLHGNYARNNQGTTDTFGHSFSPSGWLSLTSGDTIDARVRETGDAGGNPASPTGWVGIIGIDLDSLAVAGPTTGQAKRWNGTSFDNVTVRGWDGTSWLPVKFWSGSEWIEQV